MRKLPGNRKKLLAALLPIFVVSLLSAVKCGAQTCIEPYGFANNPTTYWYDPTINSVSPTLPWVAGQTFDIAISGTGLVDDPSPGANLGGCSLNVTLTDSGSVTLSNVSFVSATLITATVAIDAGTPSQTACVTVGGIVLMVVRQPASTAACPPAKVGGVTGPGTATAEVQIVASGPTITSVTPLGWWASQKKDITITGSGFLTSSDAGGPSQVTATAAGVTLSDVQVVSATQITAKVDVAKDAQAETVTLTVTNPSTGSGSPNSATANPAPVVLPVPVIQWLGKKISGDNAKTQKVKTGQPVELTTTPATLPGGFSISKSTWDIDGTTIKSFAADDSGIKLQETDLDKQNTNFYWLYPEDGPNVTYDYCATGSDGVQYCASPQAKATFDASGPNSSLSTHDSDQATIEQLVDCTDNNTASPYLGYGDIRGPAPGCPGVRTGTPGIRLTASGASGGSYVFVQLIDADSRTYTGSAGNFSCTTAANLDTGFPYPPEPNSPNIASDGPQMPLPPAYLSGERNFLATMYLLWQPSQLRGTSTASIPVPIGHQQWTFVALTDQKQPIGRGKWTKPTLTAHGDTGAYASSQDTDNNLHGYPIWTALATEVCP